MCSLGRTFVPVLLLFVSLAGPSVAVAQIGAAENAPHVTVICKSQARNARLDSRWYRELLASVEGFSNYLRWRGISNDYEVRPQSQCPPQIKHGCYSQNGTIYCSDLALERALFALALLLKKPRTHAGLLAALRSQTEKQSDITPQRINQWKNEAMLELLGFEEYRGYSAFIIVDQWLFPSWWETYRYRFSSFSDSTWLSVAKDLHEKNLGESWGQARDLMIWFILGHESFHSFRSCPIKSMSEVESEGLVETLATLQQHEAYCPSPPDNAEVNADACGLRWLAAADRSWTQNAAQTSKHSVARAASLLTLFQLFEIGLRVPRTDVLGWSASGYLYPHLRTFLVHRQLYKLNGSEDRLGLCGDWKTANSLNALRESANRNTVCVRYDDSPGAADDERVDVLLTPDRGGELDPFNIFSYVEVPAKTPGINDFVCLDGVALITRPVTAISQGDRSVRIKVLSITSESPDSYAMLAKQAAQEMFNRPYIHAALSVCLPPGVNQQRLRLQYSSGGRLIEAHEAVSDAQKDCVKSAIGDLRFGDSIDTAPISPSKVDSYVAPGWSIILRMVRSD